MVYNLYMFESGGTACLETVGKQRCLMTESGHACFMYGHGMPIYSMLSARCAYYNCGANICMFRNLFSKGHDDYRNRLPTSVRNVCASTIRMVTLLSGNSLFPGHVFLPCSMLFRWIGCFGRPCGRQSHAERFIHRLFNDSFESTRFLCIEL